MSQSDNDVELASQIILKYDGLTATRGSIPIDDLLRSLGGWRTYLDLCERFYKTRSLTARPRNDPEPFEIHVRPFDKGSFITVLEYVARATLFPAEMAATLSGSWMLAKWMFRRLVTIKKAGMSLDQAAIELQPQKREVGSIQAPTSEQHEDALAAVVKLNDSLKSALSPIGESASKISVRSSKWRGTIWATSAQKAAVNIDFPVKSLVLQPTDFSPAKLYFNRINVVTGKAHAYAVQGAPELTAGSNCTIVDPILRQKSDPYTGAMHRREPIDVFVRRIILDKKSNAGLWEVTQHPTREPSLFGS